MRSSCKPSHRTQSNRHCWSRSSADCPWRVQNPNGGPVVQHRRVRFLERPRGSPLLPIKRGQTESVRGEPYVLPLPRCRSRRGRRVMRCQHVDDDIQCRLDARRVLVSGGDPPDPDQAGFAWDRLHGPGPQGTRPRSPAVDADAASSRFRADRPASEAVALPGPSGKRRGPARRDARICAEERLVNASPPDRPGAPARVRRCGTPRRRVGRAASCSPPADPRPQP